MQVKKVLELYSSEKVRHFEINMHRSQCTLLKFRSPPLDRIFISSQWN